MGTITSFPYPYIDYARLPRNGGYPAPGQRISYVPQSGYRQFNPGNPFIPPTKSARVDGYEQLQQSLQGRLLNASRTPFRLEKLQKIMDNASVQPKTLPSIPKTGIYRMDQALHQSVTILFRIPGAIQDTLSLTLRGSLLGGGSAALLSSIGAGLFMIGKSDAEKSWRKFPLAGFFGGLLGCCAGWLTGLGFGIMRSLRDFKNSLLVS